jgi:phosphoserine phosphatase
MPKFRTVLLDCDSTLSAIEGIDELAVHCREDVERLTDAAMRGRIPLEEVYGRRLELVRPTRAAIEALGRQYVARLVPDARETIAALQAAGVDVRIISGGLLLAVLAAADAVGVSADHVAAVEISFNEDGSYAGFDGASLLAANGGKRRAIEQWNVDRPAMMVGDGNTDLEARPAVDMFVAFAGVVERPSVVGAADVVVRANSLAPLLPLALHVDELVQASHRSVYDRGTALSATATSF